tara:strand:+ start:967 stop:1392 length:426 start_codon:yes stop_codon:yes gene_type:complete
MDNRKIEEYITKYNLKSSSRDRESVYMRAYLYAYLRSDSLMTYQQIGKMFNRNHATIIHALNRIHNRYWDGGDRVYIEYIQDVMNKFPLAGTKPKIDNSSYITVTLSPLEMKRLKVFKVINNCTYYEQAIKKLIEGCDIQL